MSKLSAVESTYLTCCMVKSFTIARARSRMKAWLTAVNGCVESRWESR